MKTETNFPIATRVPLWLSPEQGRKNLHERIESFVESATTWDGTTTSQAPVLALKVTAGAGKTGTTLRVIARHVSQLLGRGHVLVYLPTLALAERAAREFRDLAPDVPSEVIRGRSAARPDIPTQRMCQHHQKAAQLSGLVPSLTEALCRAKNDKGEVVEANCARECPYLRQYDLTGPRVYFLSHAYLDTRPPIDRDVPVALRVVDEKCWQTLARTSEIFVEDFMGSPATKNVSDMTRLKRTKTRILEALQGSLPKKKALRSAGITTDHLRRCAKTESELRERLTVRPWDRDHDVTERTEGIDRESYFSSIKRQRIFEILADNESATCNQLHLCEKTMSDGTRQAIKIHARTPLPRNAPLLLLDADADPEITRRLAPDAEFSSIDIKPEAQVVQVSDKTLSDTWLLEPVRGKKRRADVLKVVRREVAAAAERGVLVVATKKVLKELHADIGQVIPHCTNPEALPPLCGAVSRWFGQSMQGVNDFEDFGTVIVVGRSQPRPVHMEDNARCLYHDDRDPITVHEDGPLPERLASRLMANDTLEDAAVRAHPDPRVNGVLHQCREAHTLQAIARLRLVAPRHPKRILILGNLPLPGLPVDRCVPFDAIVNGLESEPDVSGFLKLQAALRVTSGQPVQGTRLSKTGLVEDLPRDFSTKSSGAEFRRGRDLDHMFALVGRIAKANGWPATELLLHSPKGGTPTPAIVFCEISETMQTAKRLWPDKKIETNS